MKISAEVGSRRRSHPETARVGHSHGSSYSSEPDIFALFDFLQRRLVPKWGVEPQRCCHHKVLNLARLPVPPLRLYQPYFIQIASLAACRLPRRMFNTPRCLLLAALLSGELGLMLKFRPIRKSRETGCQIPVSNLYYTLPAALIPKFFPRFQGNVPCPLEQAHPPLFC